MLWVHVIIFLVLYTNPIMYGLHDNIILLCTAKYTVMASVKPTYYADCIENPCEIIQTQLCTTLRTV